MSERRRFNSGERVALFLAADGKCSDCGRDLEPGWHGDHITPYSAGGATDVINGQALCPECNLKKGATVNELRPWQRDAMRLFDANREDFLAVATPGAGKTTFAMTAARSMLDAGEVERVIVVVPTAHLRRQWTGAAAVFNVHLDSKFKNGQGPIARDYHGAVVTYQTVATERSYWRKLSTQARTLVILDEVHHAGETENLTWGPALQEAFGDATRRLLLSGTPFRSDGAPIPFVGYDEYGSCSASYHYGYKQALRDGCVRPIEFPVLDGKMQWRINKEPLEAELSSATDAMMAQALAVAVSPDGEWMPSVLGRADEELTRVRETMPDAGGLVLAADQQLARRYVAILRAMTGETPALAISEDPNASDVIKKFASGQSRWLIAVAMVSEGVDIPRLAVGVYASKYRTRMFFNQVAGRFVRTRGADDETYASLFIPAIEPLVRFAREIENVANEVLREQSASKSDKAEVDRREPVLFELVEASGSVHTSTVLSGQEPTDAELRRALDAMTAAGITKGITPAQMALALRAAGMAPVVGTVQVDMPVASAPVPRDEQKKRLKQQVGRLVGQYVKKTGTEYKKIHYQLNRHFDEQSIDQATVESLNERINILTRLIDEA